MTTDKLSFEITQSPVLYNINGTVLESETHKVLSRSDNHKVLSVMKNSYHPLLNEDFMESSERMQKVSGFEFSGYSEISGGQIVISNLKNNLEDVLIGGHQIKDYLVLGSSFDGRYPFFIGTTTVVTWCKNQFSKLSKVESVRHTKSSPKKIDELLKSLEIYFLNRKLMYQRFEKMLEYEVDEQTKRLAADYIIGIKQEDRLMNKVSTRKLNQLDTLNIAIETNTAEFGNNLFGLFNGATWYSTKDLSQKESIFGNLFGTAAEINNRAYELASRKLELV